MCSLLSDLLNNAFEACEKIEDITNSFLDVKMVTVDDFLQIVVTNSVDKKIIIKNNELVTTKSDKVNHGIGSTNIKDIVTKYKGNIQYNCVDKMFIAEVVLFMIHEL